MYDFTGMTLEEACRKFEVPKMGIVDFVNKLFEKYEQYVVDNLAWLESMGANSTELVRRLCEQNAWCWNMGEKVEETIAWLLSHGADPLDLAERMLEYEGDQIFDKDGWEDKEKKHLLALVDTPVLINSIKNDRDLLGKLIFSLWDHDLLSEDRLTSIKDIVEDDDKTVSILHEWVSPVRYLPWVLKNTKVSPTDIACTIPYYCEYDDDASSALSDFLKIKNQYDLHADWDRFARNCIDCDSVLSIIENLNALTADGFEFSKYATDVAISTIEMYWRNMPKSLEWFIDHGADSMAIARHLVKHGKAEAVMEDLSLFRKNPKFKMSALADCLFKNRCFDILSNYSYLFADDRNKSMALVKRLIMERSLADGIATGQSLDLDVIDLFMCLIDTNNTEYLITHLDRILITYDKVDYAALVRQLACKRKYDILEDVLEHFFHVHMNGYLPVHTDPTDVAKVLIKAKLFACVDDYYGELIEAGVDEDWLFEQLMPYRLNSPIDDYSSVLAEDGVDEDWLVEQLMMSELDQ